MNGFPRRASRKYQFESRTTTLQVRPLFWCMNKQKTKAVTTAMNLRLAVYPRMAKMSPCKRRTVLPMTLLSIKSEMRCKFLSLVLSYLYNVATVPPEGVAISFANAAECETSLNFLSLLLTRRKASKILISFVRIVLRQQRSKVFLRYIAKQSLMLLFLIM
jgi:hypothetical protein